MSNKEKYDAVFIEIFEIKQSFLTDELEYQSIREWDSVGHMSLIAELEDVFDIMLEMDDIVDFGSYNTGIKTLERYGVKF
jgi:acyl carrier protein